MSQNVDAHHVRQPESSRPRPANRLPGQRVHFFNRQPLLQHQVRRVEHHRNADAIGNKVRRIVGKHHLLAQPEVGKCGKRAHHGRIALRSRNHLQQPHIARRIEEVRPEEPLPVRSQSRGNLPHRQS